MVYSTNYCVSTNQHSNAVNENYIHSFKIAEQIKCLDIRGENLYQIPKDRQGNAPKLKLIMRYPSCSETGGIKNIKKSTIYNSGQVLKLHHLIESY